MKIAFDENVPIGMVRVFDTFAKEHQLRKLAGKFEIKSALDYAPKPGDSDYIANNDMPWLKRFAADGGKVVISGDTKMKKVPHERLALIECGFIVIFFDSQWSNWKFFRKCALLLHWWPEISKKIKKAKPGSFYHIPCNWDEDGKLRRVSNKDPKLLRIERRQKARKRSQAKKPIVPTGLPLFDHVKLDVTVSDAEKNLKMKMLIKEVDDKEQSKLFIEKAREIDTDDHQSASDKLLGGLAKMPPQSPPKPKRKQTLEN